MTENIDGDHATRAGVADCMRHFRGERSRRCRRAGNRTGRSVKRVGPKICRPLRPWGFDSPPGTTLTPIKSVVCSERETEGAFRKNLG